MSAELTTADRIARANRTHAENLAAAAAADRGMAEVDATLARFARVRELIDALRPALTAIGLDPDAVGRYTVSDLELLSRMTAAAA